MRISVRQLILVFIFTCSLYTNKVSSQTILEKVVSIQTDKIEIAKIISLIREQTAARFIYSSKAIKANRKISVSVTNKKLSKFLEEILQPLGISYKIVDEQILLYAIKDIEKRGSIPSNNIDFLVEKISSVEVKGIVTDEKDAPLEGASVYLKSNRKIGTTTDASGRFNLKTDIDNPILLISYTSYKNQEFIVKANQAATVKLQIIESAVNDVVVIGYGTQRKKDITGSVSKLSESTIKSFPIVSADQAIQGRAAGVQVIQSSGAPGGAVQVRIRGVNTTAGNGANQPLYVIDGVPLFYSESANSLSIGNEGSSGGTASNAASPLSTISPNDIESIEILKDASASAIYGARAANGVILITTKSGRIGKPLISINQNFAVQSLRKKIAVLNAQERASLVFEHRRNAGTRGSEGFDVFAVNPFTFGKGTDWQNEVFKKANIANYNLSVSGGTDRVTYNISGDYLDQQGILINTFAKRIGTRVNFDVRASDKLKFGTRTTLNYQWESNSQNDEFFQGLLNGLLTSSPLTPVFDGSGNYAGSPNNLISTALYTDGGSNPVANQMERTRSTDRYRIISNMYGEYLFNSHFKFKSSFGIDYLFTELRQVDPVWYRGVNSNAIIRTSELSPKTYNWIAEQTLNYDQKIREHSISAVAGFSAQNIRQKSLFASGSGSVNNILNQLGNQPIASAVSGGIIDQGLISQFIRTNYTYKGKYLLTATVRRDGSSRFGANNKYGLFPSGSIGWRLSEERFLKNNRTISDLKIRASYGSTGSQEIDNFLYSALMSGTTAVFGNTYIPGVTPTRFQNEDIRWERNNQFDIGIDFGLFNNYLNITVDYYRKTTNGLLAGQPLSVISGVGNAIVTNIGIIRNTGFEFALNAKLVDNQDFKWNIDLNVATNKNEVVSLGNLSVINGQTIARVNSFINRTERGSSIGAFYVLRNNGQYLTWTDAATAPIYNTIASQPYFAPGDLKIVDQNKDGKITDEDRQFYGSPLPDYFGGITSNFSYKNWSFSVFAPFQHGNLIWNQPFLNGSTFEGNVWRSVYNNRYRPNNPDVQTSIPVPRNNSPLTPSDFYLQDGSFLRIRSLTIAYEFSPKQFSFLKFSKIKIYAQGNNLFVFTKYQGWDPEVNSFGSNVATNGIDIGAYPQARSFNVGANISF